MAAYTTKKPTGLSIKRTSNAIVVEWKIGDKDYGQGQTFQYRYPGGKWTTIEVGTVKTKTYIALDPSAWFPYVAKICDKIYFRVRGRRRNFTENGKTYTPSVSAWATKEFSLELPNRTTVTAALSSSVNNATVFSWNVSADSESKRWFTRVQCHTCLLVNSSIADGTKVPASAWTAYTGSAASGSVTITEDSSVINQGVSYTRWFRVRACGPKGASAWAYVRHVYAIPYQANTVKVSTKSTSAGGYLCTATWKTPLNAAHPVDKINVQYTFTTPTASLGCPDTASWTDAMTLAYKDGSDATAFSVDSSVSADQCMFVRINTVHDRNTTYGVAVLAIAGELTAPSGLSVTTDDTTYRATVTATNNSAVPGAFLAVKYMTTANPNGFIIGIIPNGETSITVQCPEWSDATAIKFGVYAVVGSYTATTRADGVSSYAVKATLKSSLVTYGGTVPAAPTSVTAVSTDITGTVRVTFDWAWEDATVAELSWADHADAWESTDGPSTYEIDNTHASAWNISGLDTGKTWYIRVRLASGSGDSTTYGAYSDIVAVDLSSAPTVPILALSSAVITEDGSVTASWSFASSDGTTQASAELATVADGVYTKLAEVETAQYITISAEDAEWTNGNTYDLAVRVTSASGKQSDWSEAASVTVAEPLEIAITSTSLVEQTITEDEDLTRTVMSLTELPLTLTVTGADEGGTTRVIIERAEAYHMIRPDERDYNGFEGETVLIYSQIGEDAISIDLDDLTGHLDDGALYRLIATVQDGLGQSAETEQLFEVHWTHQALIPTATVTVDTTNLVTQITPVAPEGALLTDTCDIYRLSVDRPELIYPNAEFGTTYVDPYPTIGELGGHRLVFRTANGDYITEDNTLAWTDYNSEIDTDYNIIEFGTGRVMLQYDVDLSHTWKKDFIETQYLGGSIQGDWNQAVSRTGSFAANVVTDDVETIEEMRRLAVYPGVCHVRTKDGSSYAADVQVSESYSQDTAHKIVAFTLTITRVDPEGYEGMTLAEWQETEGE